MIVIHIIQSVIQLVNIKVHVVDVRLGKGFQNHLFVSGVNTPTSPFIVPDAHNQP